MDMRRIEERVVCEYQRTPGCEDMMGYNTVHACARYQAQARAWGLHRHDMEGVDRVWTGCG